ncbi:protocatechuate 3,4-dioxygenase subunit alpha [Plastoroseomonas arctica]|uniref:Protocatechuate 3,4-dioxygenase subunit alpha n=1 Tax=Plastoroseomonas arctica TaxID=1509237 RepID=A0AAF1K0S1_9PROT|nr:protocatechuate 3,4-dioxygenase subunit alpha [Plastoroseomonas arctica]MBR0654200.1 protocatechuate 3,4-dioxygenase subunit alpha [Plastoroseomonas arctica]
MDYLPETPSQTAGPYVHIGLIPRQAGFEIFANNLGERMVSDATRGERIRIEGRIFDGAGSIVRDALMEIWQADAHGRHNHPADTQDGTAPDAAFHGWGRTGTDFATGIWAFDTIKPGAVTGRSGHARMAPHVSLWIVARGINLGLSTRMYFGDEEAANAADPVLKLIDPARRNTLIAPRGLREGAVVYGFDIRLQGEGETVFLDI